MLRVWSEFLSYREARRPGTLDLLELGRLHPLFAVDPQSDLDELAELLRAVSDRGLQPGIWPLVDRRDGYWPSVENAELFADHLRGLVGRLERRGVTLDWVAFDLEPPFRPGDSVSSSIRRAARRALVGGTEDEPFGRALGAYRGLIQELNGRQVRTLGITPPPPVADLETDGTVWQRALQTPWSPLDWDRAGFMAYGSMIAGYSAGWLSHADVRALHYDFFRRLHGYFGGRAHVSVGVTGTGVYGDEPVYTAVEELALDVSAARAVGIDDIAIFCLEGLLQKAEPGAWVEAIASAPPKVPPPRIRAEGTLLAARLATGLLSTLWPARKRRLRTSRDGS